MHTAAEQAYNKALNGEETKQLIRADFDKLLNNMGELSNYIAFTRVGWKITLVLQTANAYRPQAESEIEHGDLPIDDAVTHAEEVSHQVDSPNVERVHAGIPIPVKVKELDGTTVEKRIQYELEDVKDLPPQQIEVKDVTAVETEKLEVKRRGRPPKTR